MKTRVISGVIIAAICIAVGIVGGPVVGIILIPCALIGYHELCKACGVDPKNNGTNALEILGYIAIMMYYLGLIFGSAHINLNFFTIVMIVLLLLSLMGVYVLTFPKFHADQVMAALFSFVYCPVLMSFIYRARCLPYGVYVYALIFFCTWICDTCAYFAGRAFGKHKMAPVLSPKKTIEGFFGGIIGSAVLCFLLSIFLKWQHPEEPASFGLTFTIIGLVGGTVSAIGDLAASAIKRDHNIKDYGNCIPGHGGIMDRFDSVIFTAPVIYLLAFLMIKQI